MKKSLAHLPKEKQAELILITEKIAHIAPQTPPLPIVSPAILLRGF